VPTIGSHLVSFSPWISSDLIILFPSSLRISVPTFSQPPRFLSPSLPVSQQVLKSLVLKFKLFRLVYFFTFLSTSLGCRLSRRNQHLRVRVGKPRIRWVTILSVDQRTKRNAN
jgi:hypothetical protein